MSISDQFDVSGYQLWHAAPHDFGQGKVHALDLDNGEKSLCGESIHIMGGWRVEKGTVNCKRCLRSIESKRKWAEREQDWQERDRIRQQALAEEQAEWWRWYNSYLQTPKWFERRDAVLRRAKGMCEGCGKRKAEQIHHLTYRNAGDEFLWQLVAVCKVCHDRFHEDNYAA